MSRDIEMQKNITAELKWQPNVNPAQIGVTVEDAVVTLTGTVDTYAQKFAAERAVERVAGVRAIADDLKVEIPALHTRTDSDIARAAANALFWDVEVPDAIEAVVRDGWITLKGTVDFFYQKAAAERVVRYLGGVTGVSNAIAVARSQPPQPNRVKAEIEAALKRSAELDAKQIQVEASDGTVTLKGTVRTWSEREDAVNAAWNAPGVQSVNDQMQLVF